MVRIGNPTPTNDVPKLATYLNIASIQAEKENICAICQISNVSGEV